MGVYIKGKPSEGIYRLTYQETSDKGMVAVLEGEDIAFIGQIVKAPHGDLIDRGELQSRVSEEYRAWDDDYDALQILGDIEDAPTVIEAEAE